MLDAVKVLGPKAKYVLSVGTCAGFGGCSQTLCLYGDSDSQVLKGKTKKPIINLPSCSAHPNVMAGTILTTHVRTEGLGMDFL